MDILRQFPEDPLPPSGVDIARAVRTGKRRRRIQRTGTAALGLVAVAAAAIVVVPRLTGQPSIIDDNPAGQTEPISCARPAPLPALANTDFDPLQWRVDASAVVGYHVEQYGTSAYWQQLELKNADGTSMVDVTIYGPHGQPVFSVEPSTAPVPVDPTTGTPTEAVGGSPAYWLPGRQATAQFEVARLAWQWAPNAWAFVGAADATDSGASGKSPKTEAEIAQLRSVARAVAVAVRIGEGTPVTAPFTMPVPDCTRLVGAHLYSSTANDVPFTRMMLVFAPDAYEQPTNPLLSRGEVPVVQVIADSYATPGDKPGSATSVIDGHPAYVSDDFMVVHGVNGFALELRVPGGTTAGTALFRSITIVPGATGDPATWTDSPLTK